MKHTYLKDLWRAFSGCLPILVSRARLSELEDLERLVMEEEMRADLEEKNLAYLETPHEVWTHPANVDDPLPQVNHKAGECVAKFISPYSVPMGMN